MVEVSEVAAAPVDGALSEYTAGIVPEGLRIAIRDAYQAARITQGQAATMLGLSRPPRRCP